MTLAGPQYEEKYNILIKKQSDNNLMTCQVHARIIMYDPFQLMIQALAAVMFFTKIFAARPCKSSEPGA
jgi:hypothetical protein